jgi:hypothetical protein
MKSGATSSLGHVGYKGEMKNTKVFAIFTAVFLIFNGFLNVRPCRITNRDGVPSNNTLTFVMED